MKFRKIIALTLVLVLSALLASGCQNTRSTTSGAKDEKPKVTLWTTGSDNLRVLFETAISAYNERKDSTSTVELQFIMSGSGDQKLSSRIAAAKLAGEKNTDFDLLAENGSSLAAYVEEAGENFFVKLDFNKIPNYKNLKMKSGFYTEYVVPYRGTTVVMAYDSARLPNPPKTWDELIKWIKANPGRFAYNSPGSGGRRSICESLYKGCRKKRSSDKWTDNGTGWEALGNHPFLYKWRQVV